MGPWGLLTPKKRKEKKKTQNSIFIYFFWAESLINNAIQGLTGISNFLIICGYP